MMIPGKKIRILALAVFMAVSALSCENVLMQQQEPDKLTPTPAPVPSPSSGADILGFSVGWIPMEVSGDAITLRLPYPGTLRAAPTIVVSDGATLSPPSGAEQDFSSPVTYRVTAQNGTVRQYTTKTTAVVSDAPGLASALAVPYPVELAAAFYDAVNDAGSPLVIDPGTADRPQTGAISITGAGVGADDPALEVGMILANDNITLSKLRFAVTDSGKAAAAYWSSGSYYAALFVNRFSGPSTRRSGSEAVNHRVVIEDCDISFTGTTGMTAGIFVTGNAGTEQTAGITIRRNNVAVTGVGASAAQALLIYRFDPRIEITGNTLKASNTGTIGAMNAPASALFLQIDSANLSNANVPVSIRGNTLSEDPFSFYVNIRGAPDRRGPGNLLTANFSNLRSTWITGPDTSVYEKLVKALVIQNVTGGYGFGYTALYLANNSDFVVEQYEIANKNVTHINYWGYNDDTSDPNGLAYGSTEVYGRKRVGGYATEGNWHWTRLVADSDGYPGSLNE